MSILVNASRLGLLTIYEVQVIGPFLFEGVDLGEISTVKVIEPVGIGNFRVVRLRVILLLTEKESPVFSSLR